MIIAQVDAVASDIGVDAVKIGMLADEATIEAVVDALDLVDGAPVVVDPVMIAESGATLLDPNAKAALIERILPRASVVTPNLPEARALSGLGEAATQAELGAAMLALGPDAVVVTGGHSDDGADVLVDAAGSLRIEGPRYPDGASHGSGCTHSSALAAFLARGEELADAARWAKEVAAEAVGNGLRGIGRGAGPVDVFGIARDNRSRDEARAHEARSRRRAARRGRPRGRRGRGAPGRGSFAASSSSGCGRRCRPREGAAARRSMVRDFAEVPRDAERVVFYPAGAGRAAERLRDAAQHARAACSATLRPTSSAACPVERRARELLRSALAAEDFDAYERFGFFSVPGRGDPASGYAYLVYPQRPLVAYETATGRLLSEYCVRFRDDGERLPDADDVLAKWLALHGRERELIATANVNPPGHQVDPDHARRDLARLREWRSARAVDSAA